MTNRVDPRPLSLATANELLARARRERAPERAVDRLRALLEYPPELLGECAEMIEQRAEDAQLDMHHTPAAAKQAVVLRTMARALRDVAEVAGE